MLGRPVGEQEAAGYYAAKEWLVEVVTGRWTRFAAVSTSSCVRATGSPAEINLLEHDIVNLGLAGGPVSRRCWSATSNGAACSRTCSARWPSCPTTWPGPSAVS